MSYSIKDAQNEFEVQYDEVLRTRDVAGAYHMADLLAEMGDEEEADMFIRMAKQWQYEDDGYDQFADRNVSFVC